MSTLSIICEICSHDMTDTYYKGDLQCPKCNHYNDSPIKRGEVEVPVIETDTRIEMETILEEAVLRLENVDQMPERAFNIGDRMAIHRDGQDIIGKVTNIGLKLAVIEDEETGEEQSAQIEELFLPPSTDLDEETNSELLDLKEQLATNNSESGISNTTRLNFTTQLIKMLNNKSEEITNSLSFSTTNIRIQEIIKDIFGNVDAQEKARLFTSNISRIWVKNRIYFNGDCLAKINFDMLFQNHASIGLYAKKTNVGIDPIEHLSDRPNSALSAWIIIIKNGDSIFKFEPSDVRQIKTSDIEIQRWKNKCENILTCTVCDKIYKAKSEILKESNIPMPGYCLTPSCNSIIFTSEASKIGSGARHYARIATKSHEENKLTLLYNITDKLFYVTTDKFAGEIDVIELWEEFEKTGDMQSSAAKYIPVKHKSNKLEDILELELKLHRSSADLYAKLRGIPLALNSKSTTDLSLTLHELHWLDEQIMRILKKLR